MSSIVLFEGTQEVLSEDLLNIGKFGQSALDGVVLNAVAEDSFYTGLSVTQVGQSGISVAVGNAVIAGKFYPSVLETGFTLTSNLPLSFSKIATLVVGGNEVDTAIASRDYVIDQNTGEAEARTAPRERRRLITMQILYGVESANPVRGVLSPGAVAVCDILITPAGIQTITMLTANHLPSVQSNRDAIRSLEGFRDTTGKQMETLATDIAGLTAATRGIPSPHKLRRMSQDISRANLLLGVKDASVLYSSDFLLNEHGSDPTHPNWLCRIEEGGRFPAAAERIVLLRPLNSAEPKLRKVGDFALPAFVETPRISFVGNDGEFSISQLQHQTVTMVERQQSHSQVRYGTSYTTCTNASEFANGTYDDRTKSLRTDGQNFNVEFTGKDWDPENQFDGDHKEVRLTETWTDSWTTSYWDAVTVQEGLAGSIVAQTFLNANAGWATSIDLYFNRVAETGDVHVLLCELTPSASPSVKRAIAKTTIAAADLKTWPNKTNVPLKPRHLDAGVRYGIILITPGNHHTAIVNNNKFTQGTFFHSTDEAWFQGDLTKDMPFQINFAKFSAPRVEVDLEPAVLENGIANIDIITVGGTPNSSKLVIEYKKDGSPWTPIDPDLGPGTATPSLNGLPALLQMRAVFIGSTDDMPGFDTVKSQIKTWRPRNDACWVSKLFDVGAGVTTSTVELDFRVEAFEAAHHNVTMTLLSGVGETVETPDTTVTHVDPLDPKAFVIRYIFNLAAPTQTYRFKANITTDAATNTFHIASIFQQAL